MLQLAVVAKNKAGQKPVQQLLASCLHRIETDLLFMAVPGQVRLQGWSPKRRLAHPGSGQERRNP